MTRYVCWSLGLLAAVVVGTARAEEAKKPEKLPAPHCCCEGATCCPSGGPCKVVKPGAACDKCCPANACHNQGGGSCCSKNCPTAKKKVTPATNFPIVMIPSPLGPIPVPCLGILDPSEAEQFQGGPPEPSCCPPPSGGFNAVFPPFGQCLPGMPCFEGPTNLLTSMPTPTMPHTPIVQCAVTQPQGGVVVYPWVFTVSAKDGEACIEVPGGGTMAMTCKDLQLKCGDDCGSYKVGVCDKQVQVNGPHVKACADSVAQITTGKHLLLQGHVRLKYSKGGQHIEATADKVMIGLADGSVQIQTDTDK